PIIILSFFFFSSRRRHTRFSRDWSSDVCSSDLRVSYLHNKKGRRSVLFYFHSINQTDDQRMIFSLVMICCLHHPWFLAVLSTIHVDVQLNSLEFPPQYGKASHLACWYVPV